MKLSKGHKPDCIASESRSDSILFNNKGIALVMVLILSLISLAIMSGLIYMVTSGTQVSGMAKRYQTALEAGKSGKDIAYQIIGARGNPYSTAEAALFNFSITASTACLNTKMNNPTYVNGVNNWGVCNMSPDIITEPVPDPATYDMTFQLGNNPTYTVYAKIVDTVEGNSSIDEGLQKTGVVISNSGEVTVVSVPYLYDIEILTENAANTMERSKLSVLYQY